MTRRALAWGFSAALALVIGAFSGATAQTYPTRPIDIIVPFAPGGSTSLSARAISGALEERFKVPVRVVHKPGGNTIPAVDEVMRSAPDGYTLLLESASSSSLLQIAVPGTKVNVMERSFINAFGGSPQVIFVASDSPLQSLADVVAELKRDPAAFTWTSLGGASGQDFTFRKLFKAVGIPVSATRPVASRGGSEPITMVAGGHVRVGAGTVSSVIPLLQANKIKALALTSKARYPSLPEVPTTAELGLPSVELMFWNGLSGPPGLPDRIVQIINAAVQEIVQDPKFIATLSGVGIQPLYRDASQVRDLVKLENSEGILLWSN